MIKERIIEIVFCLFEQDFLNEWLVCNDNIPVGFGIERELFNNIAMGEASKIIMKEGI